MSNQPVYRRPRSHAYSCRCPRCAPKGDFVARNGIIGPGFLILCAVVLVGFWPVLAVHGQTDTGGWRWDIHSTYAELAYLGAIAFIIGLVWLGNRPAKTAVAVPVTPERLPPPPPPSIVAAPACEHPLAGPLTNRRALGPVAWFCEECAEGFPPEFGDLRRSCCGTKPGRDHRGNCPHAARWRELNDSHRKG